MPHKTFVKIQYQSKPATEFLLFQKGENSNQLDFFISTNDALNGRFWYDDLKNDFCKKFKTAPDQFEKFYAQGLDIDLSSLFKAGSTSVAEVSVDEDFFMATSKQSQFAWVRKEELAKFLSNFTHEQATVLQILLHESALEQLPADLSQSIEDLQRAHAEQKLVIFAGAGISKDSGIPLWGEMKTKILEGLESQIDPNTDPTLIAQFFYNSCGSKKQYDDQLLKLLGFNKNPQPNEIHKAFTRLRPLHIVTTNFDDLLEKTLPDPSPYAVIRQDSDFPKSYRSQFLIKSMLGNLILSEGYHL